MPNQVPGGAAVAGLGVPGGAAVLLRCADRARGPRRGGCEAFTDALAAARERPAGNAGGTHDIPDTGRT